MERLPVIGAFLPGQRDKRAAIQKQVRAAAASLKIAPCSTASRARCPVASASVWHWPAHCPPARRISDGRTAVNLDANLRVHTRAEIVELHRRAGVPTIYMTHDQAEALSMADRVAVMMGGKLLQIDTPGAIYNEPRHIEVAQFIGTPRINILEALVSDNGVVHFVGRAILPEASPPIPAAIFVLAFV